MASKTNHTQGTYARNRAIGARETRPTQGNFEKSLSGHWAPRSHPIPKPGPEARICATQGTNASTQGTRKEHARNTKEHKYGPRPGVRNLALDQTLNPMALAPTQGPRKELRKEPRKGQENCFPLNIVQQTRQAFITWAV